MHGCTVRRDHFTAATTPGICDDACRTIGDRVGSHDELSEELNAAVAGSNRSALVAQAVREYLDRRSVAAAAAWHASLEGEDAGVFAELNASW